MTQKEEIEISEGVTVTIEDQIEAGETLNTKVILHGEFEISLADYHELGEFLGSLIDDYRLKPRGNS